jgi:hypothetical protein
MICVCGWSGVEWRLRSKKEGEMEKEGCAGKGVDSCLMLKSYKK